MYGYITLIKTKMTLSSATFCRKDQTDQTADEDGAAHRETICVYSFKTHHSPSFSFSFVLRRLLPPSSHRNVDVYIGDDIPWVLSWWIARPTHFCVTFLSFASSYFFGLHWQFKFAPRAIFSNWSRTNPFHQPTYTHILWSFGRNIQSTIYHLAGTRTRTGKGATGNRNGKGLGD